MKNTPYFDHSIKSLGHTPIYKTHKYFARRPHNVFKVLIKHYTKEGDLVFDPFGGGGVTLIEGLTENRRVIISDINPIASFIQLNQANEISDTRFSHISNQINQLVTEKFKKFYTTTCTTCSEDAHVRWYEHAYGVSCPSCNKESLLDNDSKAIGKTGKARNGVYTCNHCEHEFRAVNTPRISSTLLSIRFKCGSCGSQDNKKPDVNDHNKLNHFIENYDQIVNELKINIPEDNIPKDWDRQQEDCLHRKGFLKFSDLFTKRNLIACGYYFSCIDSIKQELKEEEYQFLLYLISSLLRYTNNMNFSTSSWMDGRPVAWAKHAYWTPNQFIEVNPIEYFSNRVKAFKSSIKDRSSRFSNKIHASRWKGVTSGKSNYFINCGDSSKLKLPNESVDFILTDPPYGSNVQYGELCKFWEVWLNNKYPFNSSDPLLKAEAVVHRRTKSENYSKDFSDYYLLLNKVFSNCHRVLKPGGIMAFTFNNKDIRAWHSVIKAAIDAGFYIEPEGIFYQEGIEAYRDTAHLRHDGTPQGDFIYSFKKTNKPIDFSSVGDSFTECLKQTLNELVINKNEFSLGEFYISLFSISTLCLIKQISEGKDESFINSEFSHELVEKFLDSQSPLKRIGNRWIVKEGHTL